MNEFGRRKRLEVLDEVLDEYNEKIRRENSAVFKGIFRLSKLFPVYAIVDINPLDGRVNANNHEGNTEIIYDLKRGRLEISARNGKCIELSPQAKENFYESLIDSKLALSKGSL